MSSGYFFNGINIANLIQSGNKSVPNYTGFPQSTPFIYTSGFDKPVNFSYTINGTDVSNYATSKYFATSDTTASNIPLQIPGTNFYFNSVCVCGAGGGGGGGGGGFNWLTNPGGTGGKGGDGAYAAILNYPVSGGTSISYNVGSGGDGGTVKGGGSGETGNNTSVNFGNTIIISCDGGTGAESGKNATIDYSGIPGAYGTTPSGKIAPGYSGIDATDVYAYPEFPPQQGDYSPSPHSGNGGDGGNSPLSNSDPNDGDPGNAGFILVYFSYE